MKIRVKSQDGETREVNIEPNKSLLKELEKAGYEIPHACSAGACGACMCKINEGSEYVKKDALNEPMFPLAEQEVMTCIATLEEAGDGKIEIEL